MPDISIIIVNYNVKEFLLNLLSSLKSASTNINVETIIVDNASQDGSVEAIRKEYPSLKLIANKENIGFGKANNLGLKIAQGKYIILLNPDTIVKEDTFEKLMIFFEKNKDAGMVGCKVLNPDGTLQSACRRSFPSPWVSFTKVTGFSKLFPKSKLFAKYNLTYLDENKTYEVDAISGAFMMIRREVYEKIGGFDPQFFMYGEDLDLCYRTQQAGYKVYYFNETEIIHYKGESTKRSSIDETKVFYNAMNIFVKKHFTSSVLLQFILQTAISVRRTFAFINVYKLPLFSALLDFVIVTFAILIAENFGKPRNWQGFPASVKPWIYLLPALVQVIIASLIGVYKRISLSVLRSLIALLLGSLFLSAVTFFFKQYAYSRGVFLISYFLTGVGFISWRIFAKLFFKVGLLYDPHRSETLIVGTDEKSLELAEKLKTNEESMINIAGFISLNEKEVGGKYKDFRVVGSLLNIRKIIKTLNIKNIIFSSENISFDKIFETVSTLQNENVEIKVAGRDSDYLVGKSQITMLENIPLIKVNYNISNPFYKLIKRTFDIFLSIFFMIILIPVLIFSFIKKEKGDFLKFINQLPSVLIGTRSFVGPKKIISDKSLLLGKMGLTGLWFIEKTDNIDEVEMKKLDLYYAKNQNVWLDLEILGRTFTKIFLSKKR